MKHSVKEVSLSNGAKGLAVRVPGTEVVRTLIEFRAGFDLGDLNKYELPHVMEHMMFTNKTYPKPRQFSREVEKNGAHSNAYTNSYSLEYDYECAAFEAERIAKLIAIQITEPTFPASELKTELGNVAEELNNNISNPSAAANNNLHSAATGLPNYTTRRNQLLSISNEDLKSWYKLTHTAANMRFIVAGDIDFDTKVLNHLNVDLPKGKRLDLPQIKINNLNTPIVEKRDLPQVYYGIFSYLPKPLDYRQLIAARIIASVLSDGFSSNLFGKAREKGLVYGLHMGVYSDTHDTLWRFGGSVSPQNALAFFKLAASEIKKAQTGKISSRQFEATKRLLRGNRARSYQKVSNLVGFYDMYFTVGHQKFEEYDRLLDEITLDEAVTAFNSLFLSKIKGLSFVGNITPETAEQYQSVMTTLWHNG